VIDAYTSTPGQPLVFIGHSWGAMYATWFINEHGDYGGRVKGAVLSEPGAFTKTQLDAFLERMMAAILLTGGVLNDGTWSRQLMSPADHARADYLRAMFAMKGVPSEQDDPANPRPFWRLGAVVNGALLDLAEQEGFDWTTHLSAFKRKVLFLRGDLNTAATLAHQRELAASYPNAGIVTMQNVGHEMSWERPAEYLAHVRTYFSEIGFGRVAPARSRHR
jgi:proline iminopeptidase